MSAKEFILKWGLSINHLGLPTVGIHVGWDAIQLNSIVETFSGREAWEKVLASTPPWFKTPQTFRELRDSQNPDYNQIIKEETENGKIAYYRTKGLREPNFCIFSNIDGAFMLLGDGNHRFLDCIYLMDAENKNFDSAVTNTKLDMIYLANFDEVIKPDLIWPLKI